MPMSGSKQLDKTVWHIVWEGLDIVVKGGKDVKVEEAEWTSMARRLSGLSIIPKVYGTRTSAGATFIYFQHLPGDPLDSTYMSAISSDGHRVASNIRTIFHHLQQIHAPPGSFGGGFAGHNLNAVSMSPGDFSFPSFTSLSTLEGWLKHKFISRPAVEDPVAEARVWEKEVAPHFCPSSPLVLTHGDAAARNILVSGTTVTGLVDWELAGWYPPWVEQYRALHEERYGAGGGADGIVGRALRYEGEGPEAYGGLLHIFEAFS